MTVNDPVVRFREVVRDTVPEDATVLVVSRGDSELLKLGGRRAWHFPQRADGVYAGYYPPDSAAAIAHVEALRTRGGEFLAFPSPAAWWLEHYDGLAEHLEKNYELVVRDETAGAIYALVHGRALASTPKRANGASNGRRKAKAPSTPTPEDDVVAQAERIFDVEFYSEQAGTSFSSKDAGLEHYLARGYREGLDPHRLFDGKWYFERYSEAAAGGESPLVHFIRNSVNEFQNPSPYFDTEYYYDQRSELLGQRANALAHYLERAAAGDSFKPNPLFHDQYYRQTYRDVRDSGMSPLEHYLRVGTPERRYVSHIHRNIFDRLRQASVKTLVRGNWKRGTVLYFARGGEHAPLTDLEKLSKRLSEEHRLDTLIVTFRRTPGAAVEGHAKLIVLEDYELACEIFRPSALHMLAHTLRGLKPALALSEVAEIAGTLRAGGIPTHELRSKRAAKSALRELDADLGGRPEKRAAPGTPDQALPKVMILSSDWTVSGVNAALEAVGKQLLKEGWDVEILFTREEEFVRETAPDVQHFPELPHRILDRPRSGVDGLWEALIADLERNAPCIVFLTYDQVANAVIPALTDRVGVISWVQADDGDYYEQAYRLGRYCNGIVCVSSHIRDLVVRNNPALAERAHVIHNTSVSGSEVASRRRPRRTAMSLVYTGRLVQYQKRILDFIDLAEALDRTGVPYEISLIGEFAGKEGIQPVFEDRMREHLRDGRVTHLGRLPRERILEELRRNAFFALLSDFEGLPLSLVEAMASGCIPMVAESPSGIPELVTDGQDGLIVRGRDYDEWAKLLVDLWEDRDRLKAMSRRARQTVRDRFTIETIGGQFDALCRNIADEITSGRYERPAPLSWGPGRSPAGDVLPPPNLYMPANFANYPGLK